MIKNSKGFSLVELMVVVAIIGILAAIAIPNFQRFSAKSKQAEAKADLSALYTAERAFQAEWQIYHSRFTVVGHLPMGTYRYWYGFGGDCGAAACTLPGNYLGPTGAATDITNSATGGTVIIVPIDPTMTAMAGTSVATATTFVAEAHSNLTGGGAGNADLWTINQAKTFANPNNGLP